MEKLKLVTDFAELRAGSLVVVKACGWCGGEHRGMLTNKRPPQTTDMHNGATYTTAGWEMLPGVHVPGKATVIDDLTVDARMVYLVDTGLESSTDTATAEPAPRKKARAR